MDRQTDLYYPQFADKNEAYVIKIYATANKNIQKLKYFIPSWFKFVHFCMLLMPIDHFQDNCCTYHLLLSVFDIAIIYSHKKIKHI